MERTVEEWLDPEQVKAVEAHVLSSVMAHDVFEFVDKEEV